MVSERLEMLFKSENPANVKIAIEVGLSLGYRFSSAEIEGLFLKKGTMGVGHELALRTGYDFSEWVELWNFVYPIEKIEHTYQFTPHHLKCLIWKDYIDLALSYTPQSNIIIPKCIQKLFRLRILKMCNLGLTEIPPILFNLNILEVLSLHGNDIEEIPFNISCLNLKVLGLNNNRKINKLPESLLFMDRLKSISLLHTEIKNNDPVMKELLDKGVNVII